jgi:hypothetical protein
MRFHSCEKLCIFFYVLISRTEVSPSLETYTQYGPSKAKSECGRPPVLEIEVFESK